jgi:AraC-like DNA-binding protein
MLTRPHGELRLQGSLTSFVIMFQPAGLSALFPVALRELTDCDYDARSVAGKPVAELEQRLGDCNSFASRVRLTDAFLARRIPDNFNTDRLSAAMDMILARNGRGRMPELAAYSGIGNRQFERTFCERFGMRPKLYARIVRFQSALDCKARSSTKSWTDVAHEFGYHDQMHMIHDFEEFTGQHRQRRYVSLRCSSASNSRQSASEGNKRSKPGSAIRDLERVPAPKMAVSGRQLLIHKQSMSSACAIRARVQLLPNRRGARLGAISTEMSASIYKIQSTWPYNVSTLSELLRKKSWA